MHMHQNPKRAHLPRPPLLPDPLLLRPGGGPTDRPAALGHATELPVAPQLALTAVAATSTLAHDALPPRPCPFTLPAVVLPCTEVPDLPVAFSACRTAEPACSEPVLATIFGFGGAVNWRPLSGGLLWNSRLGA
jgi:hypothetical protein